MARSVKGCPGTEGGPGGDKWFEYLLFFILIYDLLWGSL